MIIEKLRRGLAVGAEGQLCFFERAKVQFKELVVAAHPSDVNNVGPIRRERRRVVSELVFR